MGITVVGSLNYDLVTYTNRVPNAGETIRADIFETHTGGKGLNQAIAISKLRQEGSNYLVRMVGNVGQDSFGTELIDILEKNDVDCSNVGRIADVKTGIATILVEKEKGQNRILITEGANGKTIFTDSQMNQIFKVEQANDCEFVVFQHEIPDPCSIMKWLKKHRPNHQIIFNPSPFQPLQKEDWSLIDILIVNEIEAMQIVESIYSKEEAERFAEKIKKDFIDGYKVLCQKFQQSIVNTSDNSLGAVIITLGSEGVLFLSKDHVTVGYYPACSNIEVIDTTGAGDTFLGAVVTQLYQSISLEQAMKFATTASSITIQHKGAAESIPLYNDVLKNIEY
ncbi:hypothetical protein TPHA_0A02550 [Tetrapisispora phaffii CBS 4417]|uniref:Ribokinase n=1 Tax=Tetrapisispora phaffii (strain ATCC 24235 / CBS 4417 / NBRC 1672 / NRRL Y-8282 / UCD 70-5) TaxID=1071381 RepID=G8BN60_TETPH|nr:hypothetical protein TPHA_0A02550 [Tetrapisispora phaffii CBS 4417]CCE61338.1 hypothetical protein TPHA_0A02550 [Tetrapisispora phaffii CBS 4417]